MQLCLRYLILLNEKNLACLIGHFAHNHVYFTITSNPDSYGRLHRHFMDIILIEFSLRNTNVIYIMCKVMYMQLV